MKDTIETLKNIIEHAPQSENQNPDLLGWWTSDGYYICSGCTARIHARGCSIPKGSNPAWADNPVVGECCTCE